MKIAELIDRSCIALDLEAGDKAKAIGLLAGRLQKAGALLDVSRYEEAVSHREQEFSTAVGYGIAIPHGKSAAVRRPAVAFARLAQPVLWSDDPDDEPVHMVFLLAVPEADAGDRHLRILARLARSLLDEGFRSNLESARTPVDVLTALERVESSDKPAGGEGGES